MSNITQPDREYFSALLQRDERQLTSESANSSQGTVCRYYFGEDVFIWHQTNHKAVRIQQLLAAKYPSTVINIVDSYAEGVVDKVNDSNLGWFLYHELGGNNFIEGQFIKSIIDTLVTIHGMCQKYRNELQFVPQYRPRLLGQAIRCRILPPIKYLIDHYSAAQRLKELWPDLEVIVYNYQCITEVFTTGNLTLVHGAISDESIFIDSEGKCKLLNWAEAHWATPYIDLCRLLSLGFEFDHLFLYMETLQERTGRHVDEQSFAFCINVSIVHVLLERVSWRVRQLRDLKPQQIDQERDLEAEIDLVYRLISQGIGIFNGLQPEAIELGYTTWKNIKKLNS